MIAFVDEGRDPVHHPWMVKDARRDLFVGASDSRSGGYRPGGHSTTGHAPRGSFFGICTAVVGPIGTRLLTTASSVRTQLGEPLSLVSLAIPTMLRPARSAALVKKADGNRAP